MGGTGSEVDSEEENEEGDYTVYECPGLAPVSVAIALLYVGFFLSTACVSSSQAGEMEVKNPLFNDETPIATPNPNTPPQDAPHLPNGH